MSRLLHNITMASQTIPLFPLHVVVFPRTELPLHIFEERYKEMVGAAIRDNSEFGIVLAAEDGVLNAGCTVVVEKVLEKYPDGRMDILTRGRRRFEVLSVNDEKPWLEAEVSFFDDDDFDAPPEELRRQAVERYRSLRELASSEGRGEPDLTDRQLSFQIAQNVPDLVFLAAILRLRSETGRLKELNQFLATYIPRQRAIERMTRLAPTNGHGTKPAGL
jgi:Lon protease-like protein